MAKVTVGPHEFWHQKAGLFIDSIGLTEYSFSFEDKLLLDIHDLPPWILEPMFNNNVRPIEFFLHKITEAKMSYPYNFETQNYILGSEPNYYMPLKLSKDKTIMMEALKKLKQEHECLRTHRTFKELYKNVKEDNHENKRYWIRIWNYELSRAKQSQKLFLDKISFSLLPTFGQTCRKKKRNRNIICKCIKPEDVVEYLNTTKLKVYTSKKFQWLIYSNLKPITQEFKSNKKVVKVYDKDYKYTKEFHNFCKQMVHVKCYKCTAKVNLTKVIIKLNMPKSQKWSMKYLNKEITNIFVELCTTEKYSVITCPCGYKYLNTLELDTVNNNELEQKLNCKWCDYFHSTNNEHCIKCPKCKRSECIICKTSPYHYDIYCNGPETKNNPNKNICPHCDKWSDYATSSSNLVNQCTLCKCFYCKKCYYFTKPGEWYNHSCFLK